MSEVSGTESRAISDGVDLKALIERVREAKGADREIDALIDVATNGGGSNGRSGTYNAERYTFNIDAITALIERVHPGWHIASGTVGEQDMPWACLTEPEGNCRDFSAHHVTEALARVEVLLTALSAAETKAAEVGK